MSAGGRSFYGKTERLYTLCLIRGVRNANDRTPLFSCTRTGRLSLRLLNEASRSSGRVALVRAGEDGGALRGRGQVDGLQGPEVVSENALGRPKCGLPGDRTVR